MSDIYNLIGQNLGNIFKDEVNEGQSYHTECDSKHLAPGTYLYKFQTPYGTRYGKIFLVR